MSLRLGDGSFRVELGVREANVYFDAFVPTGVEPLQSAG
jgi:hypothetical protein